MPLGAGEALVGRSHECDNPPWVAGLPVCTRPAFDISMLEREIDAEVKRRLKAGEPLYHVDAELINSLEPDLVITQEHCDVCAVTPSDVNGPVASPQGRCWRFRPAACREFLTGSPQSAGAGPRTGCGESGGRDVKPDEGRPRRGQAPSCAALVALEWTDPVFAMGNWGPELVEAANGRLMLGEKGEFSRAIDWQRVRDADPEWLIVAPCGFDLERTTREVPTLDALPGWFDLRSADGNGGLGGRQQILQPIRDHDRRDGGDPGGNPARIFGRTTG